MNDRTEDRQSCAARMLDIRGYVIAARRAMIHTEPIAAMAMVLVFGLIAIVLLPIWGSFDLLSTWEFTTSLRASSEDVVYQAGGYAEAFLGMSVGALLVGVVFTGFTLLPSLFELAFPTVNHPLLNLVLWASLIFDYTTDWQKASSVAGGWSDNPLLSFVYTALFCGFVSVAVQALLVICLTVVLFGCIALLRGPARQARAVVIDG